VDVGGAAVNKEIERLRKLELEARDAYREATRVADEATKAHVRLQLAAMGVEIGVTVVYAKRFSSDREAKRWIADGVIRNGKVTCFEVKKNGTRWGGRMHENFELSRISTVQP